MVTKTVTPRIDPLEPPYDAEIDAQLQKMMPAGVPPIGLFRTFAKNLPLTEAMTGWGRYELGRNLSLSMRDREIVIDRTCARCGCDYEWGVHVVFFAERACLNRRQVASLAGGSHYDECWENHRDRLLIRTVDALHDTGDVDDHLWDALAGEFTEANLLDLLVLCGWYHAISFVAKAVRVPFEAGAPTILSMAGATSEGSSE
jgi:alkylhydroperoxidase family enzyme